MNVVNRKLNVWSPKPLNSTEQTTPKINKRLKDPFIPIFSSLGGKDRLPSFYTESYRIHKILSKGTLP